MRLHLNYTHTHAHTHADDIDRGRTLLGSLDLAFLFSYAVGHFIRSLITSHTGYNCRFVLNFDHDIHNYVFYWSTDYVNII